MSGETDVIARHEQDGRVLSGGTDSDRLAETMERHAPPESDAGGTTVKDQAVETGSPTPAAPDAKPTRGQQRFAELAKARDEQKARADAAERERDELKARISAPPAATPAPAAEPTKPAATQPPTAAEFDFPEYEAWEQANPGKDWNVYRRAELNAYADWRDKQANIDGRIAQTIAQREAAREMRTVVDGTHAKGREAYADFDAMLTSGPGAGIDLHADPVKAGQRCDFIFRHPQSEHLQYAIMKDAALATKLAGMSDIEFGLELSRLSAPAAPPQRAERKPPAAPYQPVNGNTPTVAPSAAELAGKGHDFDASGYREKRAAERKRAGRV
jgi:hypothetical protein